MRYLKLFQSPLVVLIFLMLTRLVAMDLVPLNDSTEARYGEIARLMLTSGDWITPMHRPDEPFWAKPPLSTWLSALSMKLFGINELAARLPALLLSIAILWMIWGVVKTRSGRDVANLSVVVLAGSMYFLLDAGTVMTDPILLFCTTFTFVAFWQAVVWQQKRWAYLFFVALGLGLLAKGPVALALTGMPIFAWILIQNQWIVVWRALPWMKGSVLTLAIAAPWYLLAEHKTPGFLNYFIVGEHIHRFLEPGWTGDKYGFAHVAPLGMIWIYAFIGIFPWFIPGTVWLARHFRTVPSLIQDADGWMRYLLFCTFVPLLFFTFARNIIYPYVFPSLPTFAILFAELTHRARVSVKYQRQLVQYAALSGVIFLCISAAFIFKPELIAKSQDRVVDVFKNQHPNLKSQLVYWGTRTDYSAQFYSSGRAKSTLDKHHLCELLSNDAPNYVVLDSDISTSLPQDILSQLTPVSVVTVLQKKYSVLRGESVKC